MKKMNNKGFSLVELIIVIAIMAILIAVLAPQYIKYVEKSRQSADLDNWQSIVNAIQVAYADTDNPISGDTTVSASSGAITSTGAVNFANYGVDVTKIKLKSKLYQTGTLTATVDSTTGIVSLAMTNNASLAAQLGLK